jgi:hypothetical protein
MARRFTVQKPSIGGSPGFIMAGGPRVSAGSIPKAPPASFSIDLNLAQLREDRDIRKKAEHLKKLGYTNLELASPAEINKLFATTFDDKLDAKKAESEAEFSEELAEFIKGSKSIPKGRKAGDIMPTPVEEEVPFDPENFESPEAMAEAEEFWGEIGGGAATPDYGTMSSQGELLSRYLGLSPRAATEPRAISAYETAKKRLTPKEVDPWANAKGMMVGNDWVDFGRDGKELRRIRDLPKDIDWQEIKGWIGDKQGSFFRDKDDPNVYIMDGDEPKFHPVPKGFSRVRPRSEKSLSMKFNAFLEMNDDYKGLIPTPKVLLDPKDLYLTGNPTEQKAAIEFFKTEDGAVALIKAITELQKTRNKGDEARRTKIEKLIKQKEGR